MTLRIPLAWLQLIHNKIRFFAAIGGISFIAILLFIQIGFQNALFESAVRVHQSLQGDVFLTSTQYKSLTSRQGFSRTRLYQSLAVEGVHSVCPLYFQFGKLKNIENGQKYSIFIFGVDPGTISFNLPGVNRNLERIKTPNIALFDRNSRPEFGLIAQLFDRGESVQIEISAFNDILRAYRFKIGGLFKIGASFGVDGNMIINYSEFIKIFNKPVNEIDIGLLVLEPHVSLQKIMADLKNRLPEDVRVLSRQDFIDLEKDYWNSRTPIGFTFKLMVTLAFIVGMGIAYQVLYSNISSQLTQYATLKAMGHTNQYLFNVVLQQALILAVLGYTIGFIVSIGIYQLSSSATHLPVIMTFDKVLTVFFVVMVMCSLSGFFAIQKLRKTDPANII